MGKATRTMARLVSIGLFLWTLSSCALSRAMYPGEDIYSYKTVPQSMEALNAEDINGAFFPEAVYIKTRTQSFNATIIIF
jgi:hypothetical protein